MCLSIKHNNNQNNQYYSLNDHINQNVFNPTIITMYSKLNRDINQSNLLLQLLANIAAIANNAKSQLNKFKTFTHHTIIVAFS